MEQQQGLQRLMAGSQRVQRQCGCGSPSAGGGTCSACEVKATGQGATVLQKKLAIGSTDDPLEREADRVAEQVMAMPKPSALPGAALRIQSRGWLADQTLMSAPASVESVLAGSGSPLDSTLRQDMEKRFGHNFSGVRVHTGIAAAHSAREMNADAYTVGCNIVFNAGRYAPESREGGRLLAHELTHVVQQSAVATAVQRQDTRGGAAGRQGLTDAESEALANQSPIRIEGSSDERFEEVLIAAQNKLIDIVTPAEFERQLRFRVERLGSAEFAQAWTDEERFSFAEADAGERKAQLAAKWKSFIEQGYMAYLADKAAQWRNATRRMHTAAVIGNVIGEVTVTAATLFFGGGGGLVSRGGGGATLARETSKTVLKREVESVARNRAAEFADKASRLAKNVVPSPDTDTDKRRRKKRDTCETRWGLTPGGNARIFEQRAPIRGQMTVNRVRFRLDRGIPPPVGGDTTEESRKWVRAIGCPTDDAGHVLAKRFGGFDFYNSKSGNIIPQDLSFNRGHPMRTVDEAIANLHALGNDVCVLIQVSYDPVDSLRPTHLVFFIRARPPGYPEFVPVGDIVVRNESSDKGCTA